jgi:hypothetical protein
MTTHTPRIIENLAILNTTLTFLTVRTTYPRAYAVHSEVGGDNFKLKDIPTLSDYIVKKLKDFILKKFVDPSCHR